MFPRLLLQSFRRQRRRKLLAGVAITLGVGVATAMIAIATGIGDQMNRELRRFGANILVTPQDAGLSVKVGSVDVKPAGEHFLREQDLPRIKTIFWGNNIVGFAPMLTVKTTVKRAQAEMQIPRDARDDKTEVQVLGTYFSKQIAAGKQTYAEGVRLTHPWWKVEGAWPKDEASTAAEVLVGEILAQRQQLKTGDRLQLSGEKGSVEAVVSGVVTADSETNSRIVAPLAVAQQLAGEPGAVERIYVSALTKPEDDFARRDPRSLGPADHDRWYCSPYANSIAFQLEETLPNAHAEQIRQVAQNEGRVLSRISGLMWLLALAALAASALAVSAAMATSVFERRGEIGLMKAIGAGRAMVAALFAAEATALALIGGVTGFAVGALMARGIGRAVFNSRLKVEPVTFPIVLALALTVTLAGSAASIRKAMRLSPGVVLRGDA
jgi:putative ABC transport system permease protein